MLRKLTGFIRNGFNKRELVNKFANCIGGGEMLLVLSAQTFHDTKSGDENNFQINLLTQIRTSVIPTGGMT